jgi:hypothetical protein
MSHNPETTRETPEERYARAVRDNPRHIFLGRKIPWLELSDDTRDGWAHIVDAEEREANGE